MLRYKTEIDWFCRLLRYPARKRSGSILATQESARGTSVLDLPFIVHCSSFAVYRLIMIMITSAKEVMFSSLSGKCKGSSLDTAPFTMLDSCALQPRKWQLTGINCSTAAQAVAAHSPR